MGRRHSLLALFLFHTAVEFRFGHSENAAQQVLECRVLFGLWLRLHISQQRKDDFLYAFKHVPGIYKVSRL